MPNEIKFLYFDLGGVFFHWRQFPKNLSQKFGGDPQKWQEVFDKYDNLACEGKISTNNLWIKFQEELKLKVSPHLSFPEIWVGSFEPILSMHNFARELSTRYPLGVITDEYNGIVSQMLAQKKIPNLPYSPIIESWKVGFRKPKKEIYDFALAKSGYKLNEILFIDDVEKNVEGARELGWNTVHFDEWHPEKSIEEIKTKLV
jgi:FMN phosphatase YigB (HAD superfamily)